MNSKFVNCVGKNFKYGEQVTVAVSGGVDSMVLLDCLIKCEKELNIKVAHFNHSLRGDASDKDAEFVRDYCKTKKIPFYLKVEDIGAIAKEKKISVETAGRQRRYKFFYQFGGKVATAHTLSDRIETMLFNQIRGCAGEGIASIPKKRGGIIRPILCFTKDEILEYAKYCGIEYREDETNKENIYTRNYLRNKVIPFFYKINPKFENNIKNLMDCIYEDNEYLKKETEKIMGDEKVDKGIEIEKINRLHISIKRRVINNILKNEGISPTYKIIDRIVNLVSEGRGRCSLPFDKTASVRRARFYIDSKEEIERTDVTFNEDKVRVNEYEFKIVKNTNIAKILENFKSEFIFLIDYDIIKDRLKIRSKMPGDRIKLDKRPTKSLKKLFSESGLSPSQKKKILVLADEKELFWVSEYGVAQKAIANKNTKNFIIIKKGDK